MSTALCWMRWRPWMEPLLSPHPYPCRQIRATVISHNLPIYLVSTLGPHAFSAQQPERSFSFVNQVLVVLAQGLGVKCTLLCWLLWTLKVSLYHLVSPCSSPCFSLPTNLRPQLSVCSQTSTPPSRTAQCRWQLPSLGSVLSSAPIGWDLITDVVGRGKRPSLPIQSLRRFLLTCLTAIKFVLSPHGAQKEDLVCNRIVRTWYIFAGLCHLQEVYALRGPTKNTLVVYSTP